MASHRLLIYLAILALTMSSVMSATKSKPKNVIVGSRLTHDHMIQREFVKKAGKTFSTVKDKRTFPGDHHSKITQVRLLDQNKNGNGANAVVINGGPGLSYVTVEFKSVKGHSIDFVVEIYGR